VHTALTAARGQRWWSTDRKANFHSAPDGIVRDGRGEVRNTAKRPNTTHTLLAAAAATRFRRDILPIRVIIAGCYDVRDSK
jgi:hypothetical protein